MEIFVADSYELMSRQAAAALIQLIRDKESPLLCTASGDTPAGLYHELTNLVKSGSLNISGWNFVGLDEWAGMNGSDDGSCRFYLDRQLFNPLQVSGEKISFFDGRADDLQKECADVEVFIVTHKGIDVAVLGLGMNGHIGMNEPGTSLALRSHVAAIDPVTQKAGQKYFKEAKQLTDGITLGLATIMEAKNIFLLVSGQHKAEIVRRMLDEDISPRLPASLLRNHPACSIYLDAEAASMIQTV